MSDTKVNLAALRTPFPAEFVGKLPRVVCRACSDGRCNDHHKTKCGECGNYISVRHIHLDYVGHADVTIRLLEVDPEWSWAPKSTDPDPEMLKAAVASGDPEIVRMVIGNAPPKFETDRNGSPVGLWIKLTVGGVTRLSVGSCPSNQNDAEKVLIGDALRNAAMRFGVAVDLWAKGDRADPTAENATASAGKASRGGQSAADAFETATPSRPASRDPRREAGTGQQRGQASQSAQRQGPRAVPAEAVAPSDDRPWTDQATEQAASLKSEHAGAKLWQDAAAKARAGEITAEDAERIQGLISAQVEHLREQAFQNAMQLLSADDSWRPKLEELARGGDTESARAALEELGQLITAGTIDMTRGNRISRAIVAKFPRATDAEQVA